MTTNINIEKATINVLMEIDEKIYLVAMEQDNRDAITMLVKVSAKTVFPTAKTQTMLNEFLGVKR